eukprot:ANDGO_00085.mRNA.1 hypothetical protein ACA1_197720
MAPAPAAPVVDRTRIYASTKLNQKLDENLAESIRAYIDHSFEEITQRIEVLNKEWGMERLLELSASALITVALASLLFTSRGSLLKKLILPVSASAFLMQHAIQGWCPPFSVLRAFGVRPSAQIFSEKIIMKLLRGDFAPLLEHLSHKDRDIVEKILGTVRLYA